MSLLQMHMRWKSDASHFAVRSLSLSLSVSFALALCIFSSLVSKNFLQQHSREKRSTRSLFFCFKLAKDIHVVVLILCFILFLFENYLIQFVCIFFFLFSVRLLLLAILWMWKSAGKQREKKQERKRTQEKQKKETHSGKKGGKQVERIVYSRIYATLK